MYVMYVMYVCLSVCLYVCMFVCMCVCVCVCVCMCSIYILSFYTGSSGGSQETQEETKIQVPGHPGVVFRMCSRRFAYVPYKGYIYPVSMKGWPLTNRLIQLLTTQVHDISEFQSSSSRLSTTFVSCSWQPPVDQSSMIILGHNGGAATLQLIPAPRDDKKTPATIRIVVWQHLKDLPNTIINTSNTYKV